MSSASARLPSIRSATENVSRWYRWTSGRNASTSPVETARDQRFLFLIAPRRLADLRDLAATRAATRRWRRCRRGQGDDARARGSRWVYGAHEPQITVKPKKVAPILGDMKRGPRVASPAPWSWRWSCWRRPAPGPPPTARSGAGSRGGRRGPTARRGRCAKGSTSRACSSAPTARRTPAASSAPAPCSSVRCPVTRAPSARRPGFAWASCGPVSGAIARRRPHMRRWSPTAPPTPPSTPTSPRC